jgi:hypothetical protein
LHSTEGTPDGKSPEYLPALHAQASKARQEVCCRGSRARVLAAHALRRSLMSEYTPEDGPYQLPVAAQPTQGRSEPTADHEASASAGGTDPEPESLTSAAEADSPQPSTNGHDAPTIGGEAATGTVAQPAPEPGDMRVCQQCSVQTRTNGEYCPHCGGPYVRRPDRIRGPSRRTKIIAGSVAGLLLIGGGGTGVLLKIQHDNNVAAKHKQEQAQARQNAAAQAAAQQATEQANQEKRVLRAGILTALQGSITKDANGRVTSGVLDGPAITSTSCTPLGGGSTDNLTAHTGTFTCIAVNQTNSDGTQKGYSFTATVNYDSGSYTWQLGN